MIGTDENYATSSLFPYLHFADYYTGSVTPGADATMSFNTSTVTFTSSYAEGYDAASTPWILADTISIKKSAQRFEYFFLNS